MKQKNSHLTKMRLAVIASASFVVLLCAIVISWTLHLNQVINLSLAQKALTPIKDFYALGDQIFVMQSLSAKDFIAELKQYKLQETTKPSLIAGEFRQIDKEECTNLLLSDSAQPISHCIEFYFGKSWLQKKDKFYLIAFSSFGEVLFLQDQTVSEKVSVMELPPLLFAQFYGDKPILRRSFSLGEAPAICLNAVLAIEDPDFLEHGGVSLKSIARAVVRNIQQGRKAQGGSTITQQLVKNYFLTHKKTYTRKFKELIMAILLETKSTKDEILEAYLNEIYMGQNGVFEVRGFGAASNHYFGKNIENLNTAECSLLAALLNSPGRYNPFNHPESAQNRRSRVLEKLKEKGILNQEDFDNWNAFPLPKENIVLAVDPAPYFLEAVEGQMSTLEIDQSESLKVITSLNLRSQLSAKKAVQNSLKNLEGYYKSLKTNLASGKPLQAAIMGVDHKNGYVSSLIGGRSFKTAPFNRALNAKRQVGSIMKPIVYLSALEGFNSETGDPYSPLSLLQDEKHSIKYEGQEWTPQNYDKKYRGTVPFFYSLKSSLNAATAKLAVDSGLRNIVDLAKRLGIQSEIKALPSLSLGAYELSMYEVLQAYASLANMGEKTKLSFIAEIYNSEEELIYSHSFEREQASSPQNVAVLIGILKQGIENGTGSIVRKLGFEHPAAGKTGTTSDYRDSWFAGFTPFHTSVAWIGYDDNSPHGLTGASGAAILWTEYMKDYASQYPSWDFRWPEGVKSVILSPQQQKEYLVPDPVEDLKSIELIFKNGQEP